MHENIKEPDMTPGRAVDDSTEMAKTFPYHWFLWALRRVLHRIVATGLSLAGAWQR